ncbi:aldo/keto reductase [Anaerosacchariphilus polymeriproducens]|uniref:Aldo/keto reductase n=1 Tax=Anaerosacchariphilus polymeriproducens TaxID=1812858 RepID=A0A371ASB4_9FIRM|nr:aldo/keto reductase [Anaerosacchariphilus polymeriproducens]RDU22445.1 aldo/keto reductase [Anaerosacchariphilus polymeriproducens]
MNYRENSKNGDKLSILGYGCLRFTKKGNNIDQEKAEKEMLYALQNGVNYFDTAYTYGGSEVALGKFLAKGYRKDVFIATKLPHYLCKSYEDFDRFFSEELERLQTDYIDYYLMHMITDLTSFNRLKELGIEKWIQDKKENGQIKNIGFSYHGGKEGFIQVIDVYDWDFCQIQYNYLDEHAQAGVEGLKYASLKGLPVIIMEPLRGGKLVFGLPEQAVNYFKKEDKSKTPAEWGLRWLWNQPEVTVVLSGMNTLEQVNENVRIASETQAGELTAKQYEMFEQVIKEIKKVEKVGCTGCGYCMPCPQGVDIPVCFRCYNTKYMDGAYKALKEYILCTTLKINPSNASKCIQCGKCEKNCPQGISIRKELKNVKKNLETPMYKIAKTIMKLRMKY